MVDLAKNNKRLCAITAAMPGGTGLLKFMKEYPDRLFDVGIAEEHAVSMAGGLAKQGMVPVVALYSTFLQRGYDQLMQDIGLLGLHVVFAIDRAGLVGDDGPTHHGVFDVGFLRQIPGMQILAPVSFAEQQQMLRWAVEEYDGPVAIRYPRGTEGTEQTSAWMGLDKDTLCCHRTGSDVILLTYGTLLNNVMTAAEELSKQGIEATVLRLMSLYQIESSGLCEKIPNNSNVIIVEEACTGSGIREAVSWELRNSGCRVEGIDLGADFVTHGSQQKLYEQCGLDARSIAAFTKEMLTR